MISIQRTILLVLLALMGLSLPKPLLAVALFENNLLKASPISETKKPIKKLQVEAESGAPQAQYNLGYLYEKGKGVEKNLPLAMMWYQKAADQGYALAQNNLGSLYVKGEGIEKNLPLAMMWYQKAADQGYTIAQNNLGVLYEKGEGVEKICL